LSRFRKTATTVSTKTISTVCFIFKLSSHRLQCSLTGLLLWALLHVKLQLTKASKGKPRKIAGAWLLQAGCPSCCPICICDGVCPSLKKRFTYLLTYLLTVLACYHHHHRLLCQRQHIIQKNTHKNTVILHVEPKNIKTKRQVTERQTDELMPVAIYTLSHIILYTNRDVSRHH